MRNYHFGDEFLKLSSGSGNFGKRANFQLPVFDEITSFGVLGIQKT